MRFAIVSLLVIALALPAAAAERPDLVVVVVIDQFPHEYLERFEPWFGEGGFRRFLDEGADFPNARYPYAITFTSAGHATIATGRMPSEHGIIANSWYDRATRRSRNAADDPRVQPRAGKTGRISPVLLVGDSLGDRLKEAYPGSKVVSIALKDDAAALMGGRKGDAYWFDTDLPGFVTSTYYANRPAVLAFNKSVKPFIAKRTVWSISPETSSSDMERITVDRPDLRNHKGDRSGLGTSFPHPVANPEAFASTPFAHDLTLEFAHHIIATERMGTADGSPDILFLGLSAIDNLGHLYGPDSLEMADAVIRADRQLAAFFDTLTKKRRSRITVALTADHGVQSIPEIAASLGRNAGRVDFYDRWHATTFAELSRERNTIEKLVAEALQIPFEPDAPRDHALIEAFERPSLYINWNRARSLGLEPGAVLAAVRAAVLELNGVRAAFTSTELLAPSAAAGPLEAAVRHSYFPGRSGDVVVILQEGWVWGVAGGTGASHGQPVDADQRVPVMMWGYGVKRGSYQETVSPSDLARTLGTLLGIEAGSPSSTLLPCIQAPAP